MAKVTMVQDLLQQGNACEHSRPSPSLSPHSCHRAITLPLLLSPPAADDPPAHTPAQPPPPHPALPGGFLSSPQHRAQCCAAAPGSPTCGHLAQGSDPVLATALGRGMQNVSITSSQYSTAPHQLLPSHRTRQTTKHQACTLRVWEATGKIRGLKAALTSIN